MAKKDKQDITTAEEYVMETLGPKIVSLEGMYNIIQNNISTVAAQIKKLSESCSEKSDESKASTMTVTATALLSQEDKETLGNIKEVITRFNDDENKRIEERQKMPKKLIQITVGVDGFLKHVWMDIIVIAILGEVFLVHWYLEPKRWAAINYAAAIELMDENPGDAYDEAMRMFQTYEAKTVRREVRKHRAQAKMIRKKKKLLQKKLSYFLKWAPEEIEALDFVERKTQDKGKEYLILFRFVASGTEAVAYIDADEKISITYNADILSFEDIDTAKEQIKWEFTDEKLDTPLSYVKSKFFLQQFSEI